MTQTAIQMQPRVKTTNRIRLSPYAVTSSECVAWEAIAGYSDIGMADSSTETQPAARNTISVNCITFLFSESLDLTEPIPILVEQAVGEDALAKMSSSGIGASGDCPAEALDNLRDIIAAKFEHFSSLEGRLGPIPKRQFAVLKKYIVSK